MTLPEIGIDSAKLLGTSECSISRNKMVPTTIVPLQKEDLIAIYQANNRILNKAKATCYQSSFCFIFRI